MSDARLRELERRFKESGLPADEEAWVRARVRAGDLDEARLQLLAYLGYPLARLLCERPPGWSCGPACGYLETEGGQVFAHDRGCEAFVDHWSWGLAEWGAEVELRAALALVPPALSECGHCSSMHTPRRWDSCACVNLVRAAAFAQGALLKAKRMPQARRRLKALLPPVRDEEARAAIAAALLPWALGHRDPTHERTWGSSSWTPLEGSGSQRCDTCQEEVQTRGTVFRCPQGCVCRRLPRPQAEASATPSTPAPAGEGEPGKAAGSEASGGGS